MKERKASSVLPADEAEFGFGVPVAIIGAGACGLIAALAAKETGAEAVLFERDASPSGSTSLSSGFIPAAGTRFQTTKGIEDSVERLYADLMAKNKGEADPAIGNAVCRAVGPTLEWLADGYAVPFEVLDSFLYPGHSHHRMHATPKQTGADFLAYLLGAAERAGIDIVTNAHATDLFADPDGRIVGLRIARPDGGAEDIGCDALILACNGYGGDTEMVRRHIPEIAEAIYFGHTGNRGDALSLGRGLGRGALRFGIVSRPWLRGPRP